MKYVLVESQEAPESPFTRNEVHATVVHSFDDLAHIQPTWDRLVKLSGADVYQTFDWCRLWWKHYGANRQLHIILYYCESRLVGIVPAFSEFLGLPPARIKVAKMVGADYSLQLCNLPILPGALDEVLNQMFSYFFDALSVDLLLLGPLSGAAVDLERLASAGRKREDLIQQTEIRGTSVNTFFQLPRTFDGYLASIDKKQRSNYKRGSARLHDGRQVVLDEITDRSMLNDAFEQFLKLHEEQWSAQGRLGHFGDWPGAVEFNRDLVNVLGAGGLVRFHRIIADGRLVSCHYSFVFGATDYWRLPARASGGSWDKVGLGSLSLAEKIRSAIAEGIEVIEAGRGHYEYKLQYGGTEESLKTVQFMRRGRGVSIRVRIFTIIATLMGIVYYKIIVRRLSPRAAILRKPLWRYWIRCTW